jgi:Zn-dependent protease
MAVYSTYGPVKPPIRFSRTEVLHILVAMTVLILAFTFVLAGGLQAIQQDPAVLIGPGILAAVAVPTAFLLHELGHKIVAQRYGLPAEFRASRFGLFLGLFTALLLGILLAAPGAVVIGGVSDRRSYGRISAAGPVVNLIIGGVSGLTFLALLLAGFDVPLIGTVSLLSLIFVVAFINLFLGVFNMLPIPPLDGSKIVRWDLRVYLLLLIPLVTLLIFVWFRPFL